MGKTVCIDARMLGQSGIGRYLLSVIPFLIQKKAFKINLITNNEVEDEELLNFSDVNTTIANSSIYSLYEQLEIPNIVSSNNLLWVPHYNIPLLYKNKLIVTVHDLAHLALPHLFKGFHKRLYAGTMFRALKYRADKIICVSEFTKKELIRYAGIKEEKIVVIYNGVHEQWFNVQKHENPETIPYLLFVGNVKPHKNLKTLIKAFLALRDKLPHNLVIVGQKEGFITKEENIYELIKVAPERIKFTGYVTDELLKQYYIHADLFVFPSLYEGFGYPPIEAMASGCPVIASNSASIPEVCGDAVDYFSPLNVDELVSKIKKVITDEKHKNSLVKAGFKQAKKFSVKRAAENTLKTIEDFL